MLNNPTIERLKEMKLKVMANMLSEPDSNLWDLSFEERFGLMVEKEWLAKKNARIKRMLNSSSLGISNACIEDINYSADRMIDKKMIQTLSTCTYIEQKLNIVICGKTGSGKTFLACAFGNAACRLGYSAKYFRVPELLLEIQDAKTEKRYLKFLRQMDKYRLLILDDIGLKSYTLEESRDIFEITEARYNKASTILSGQVPHTQWYDLFSDPTVADGIMDRIIHNAYTIPLDAKRSMRAVMAEKVKENIHSLDE